MIESTATVTPLAILAVSSSTLGLVAVIKQKKIVVRLIKMNNKQTGNNLTGGFIGERNH